MQAYVQHAAGEPLRLEAIQFASKTPEAREVEVEVESCSLCHSDLHLLDGEWSVPSRPLVIGHEIVGRVVARGADASTPLDARVGVGWQAGACFRCAACLRGDSHLCTEGKLRTCVGRFGGLSERVRVDERFAYVLPATMANARDLAPLFCAGLTVFSPMRRLGVRPGHRVAVVGVGGLGHMAIALARALGAEVTAFDTQAAREGLAQRLGASFLKVALSGETDLPRARYDLVLVTTPASLAWDAWLRALDLGGTLCLLGVPSAPLRIEVDRLLDEQKSVTGSVVGSPGTMRDLLALVETHGVRPEVETMPMSSVNEALYRLRRGEVSGRIVLTRDG